MGWHGLRATLAQLSMSFVPMGGKILGIQIATSGKTLLLRTLFDGILGLMRLNFLSFYAKYCRRPL